MALEKLHENGVLREKVQGLLREKAGREFCGTASVRHIIDVLHNDIGIDRIRASIDRPVTGMSAVVQYPCHTLFPSEVVGFEESSGRPRMLRGLVEALGIEVRPYSRELQCCGGAGGFVKGSFAGASEFAFRKLRAIKAETDADLIVVSCITCLEHLDRMQAELAKKDPSFVPLPVFDYNQLLAVCMGFDPAEVASISTIPREAVVERIRGAGR